MKRRRLTDMSQWSHLRFLVVFISFAILVVSACEAAVNGGSREFLREPVQLRLVRQQ